MPWDVLRSHEYLENRDVWRLLQSRFRLPRKLKNDRQFAEAEQVRNELEYRRGDTKADRRYFSRLCQLVEEYGD